jgi:hypothetical protein
MIFNPHWDTCIATEMHSALPRYNIDVLWNFPVPDVDFDSLSSRNAGNILASPSGAKGAKEKMGLFCVGQ